MKTRLLRISDVRLLTGLSNSTIYRYMSAGSFPKSVKLGESSRSVRWKSEDIEKWIDSRPITE